MVNAVEPVELDLLDARIRKTRARNVVITAVVLALAAGGVVGLFAGPLGFAIAAVVVASPLLLLAVGEKRKTTRLSGTEISVRTLGSKRVELKEATQLDVFVTDMRGVRTVNLLVAGPGCRSTRRGSRPPSSACSRHERARELVRGRRGRPPAAPAGRFGAGGADGAEAPPGCGGQFRRCARELIAGVVAKIHLAM